MQNKQNVFDDSENFEPILDSQIDYYGKRVATSNAKGKILIYDITDEKSIKSADIQAHSGSVWSLAWAHPKFGNLIASGGLDKKINIFKEIKQNTWEKIFEFTQHKNSINQLSFAPHQYGLILVAGSSDGQISYHEYKNDSWVDFMFDAHNYGVNTINWAPFNKSEEFLKFVTGGCDNKVKVWVVERKNTPLIEIVSILEGHSDWVRDAVWITNNNDSKLIASCGNDNKVILWKSKQFEWESELLGKFETNVSKLSISQCGKFLAVSLVNCIVYVFKESSEGWVSYSVVNSEGIIEEVAQTN